MPRQPSPDVDPEDEPYKLTVMLSEADRLKLEDLTDDVIDELAPRRVGKGWRTKVIRALIELASEDPKAVKRIVADIQRRQQSG